MLVLGGTGADIGAAFVTVLLLIGLYFLIRFLVRLIKAPFRAARRPAPSGLGSEYEQLVSHSEKIVLPTPRRTREAEKPAPEPRLPFPPRSSAASAAATPSATVSTVVPEPATAIAVPWPPVGEAPPQTRWWRRRLFVPGWVILPLAWLGIIYLISPLGWNWYGYGFALAVAVVIGVRRARRYCVTVLHRGQRDIVTWTHWRKRGEPEATEVDRPTVMMPPER
jgi:hypothetical protein